MRVRAQLHIEAYPRMSRGSDRPLGGRASLRFGEFSGSRGAFRSSTGQQAQGSASRSGRALKRSKQAAIERPSFGGRLQESSGESVQEYEVSSGRSTDASSHVEGAVRDIRSQPRYGVACGCCVSMFASATLAAVRGRY